MARMTSDCERLSNILAWGILDMFWGTTLILCMAGVMLALDFRLALYVLAVLPVLGIVSVWFRRRILDSARIVRRTNSRITAAYNEGIIGVRTSKTFVREDENARDFGKLTDVMYRASVRNALQSALYVPLVLTLGSVAAGIALALGGADVAAGTLSFGTLLAFLAYARLFFEPVQQMARWFAEMQMAQVSAERILGLIATEPDVKDSEAVRGRLAAHGGRSDGGRETIARIEFRDVTFAYGDGPPVLEGFSLDVRAGETIALVGPTGGGKTTIVSLLCRFYEPTKGAVLFDGVDARERSLRWLQSKLGIVLQQPHLFSGTIADNLRYGDPSASDAQVEAAARLAGAHEFVAAMRNGYASEVGEGGVRLSTGEKQLLSFARAILAQSIGVNAMAMLALGLWLLWLISTGVCRLIAMVIQRRRRMRNQCIGCGHALGPTP
jgi:ATP-binding cassette subfamily B protein